MGTRAVLSYGYVMALGVLIVLLNIATRSYSATHSDSVVEVIYFVLAAACLAFVEVRLERGRLTLSGLANGPAAVLLNPLNATLVGLATGFAMVRRPAWSVVGNAVTSAGMAATGAVVGSFLRSAEGSLVTRLAAVLVAYGSSLVFVAVGMSLRTRESIPSIARRNFTQPLLIAYGYFTLAALLTTYLIDGSVLGYVLATIVFVLALALTDTIAGRRVRRVLESELTDADRHLFHSRAVEGVVHNLRNHIATAVGYLKEIDLNRLDAVDRDAVETAKAAANDAVTVLQSLAHGATPRVTYAAEPVDLNELVSRALDMARPRARAKHIELGLHEAPDGVRVRADPLLLREVATNLVNNAIDAAPLNGKVELGAGRRTNGWPYFSVSDNGPGVADENRHHLFEPHFTTKEGGTGLGLFMSYGIVREHQGQLLYEGNRRGAIFTVTLPPFGG